MHAAARMLGESGLPVRAASRLHATPAFPAGSGPDYANAVVAVDPGGRDPEAVLELLHALEARFGRLRDRRWGPRTLDLDLIAAGDAVRPDPVAWARWHDLDPAAQQVEAPDRLILPHPRIEDRLFVLMPLAEIAPDWRHPVTGAGIAALIAAHPPAAREAIRAIGPL